tara:strand:+ start:7728 stop:8444 length:717 start_codon:yes stop_codon:yes gene_type:complete
MRVQGIARYAHMINPSAPKGSDKQKFSINILIHKNDPQVPAITAEVESAKLRGFPSGFPAAGTVCWKDLALTEPDNAATRDYMSLACSTNADKGRPHFVDANMQPIINPQMDDTAVGMVVYVDAGVEPFDQVSKGVKAYLNGVMVTDQAGAIPRDALSSKPSAEQMFAGAGAPAMAAPMATTAPLPTAPVPPAPAPQPQFVMTALANGLTREAYHAANWTDVMLIEQGMMLPPVPTSF